VQPKRREGVVKHQACRLRPVPLPPRIRLPDQNAKLAGAVAVVDVEQVGVADRSRGGGLVDGEPVGGGGGQAAFIGGAVLVGGAVRGIWAEVTESADGGEVVDPAQLSGDEAATQGTERDPFRDDVEDWRFVRICHR
jgi:hypothetical protein